MIQKTIKNIIFHEFHLLAILDYNFLAPLPYPEIVRIIFGKYPSIMLRIANNFANDSFRTRACLKYTGIEIGQACVFLAGEFLQQSIDVVPNFNVITEILSVYEFFN